MIAGIRHPFRRADVEPSAETGHDVPVRGLVGLGIRAGVCLGPRLSALLAPEWQQVHLRPGMQVSPGDLDLIVLEVERGAVPGWVNREKDLLAALRHWAACGIPVVLWCTDDAPTGLDWLTPVTAVVASTEAGVALLTADHEGTHLLPPAAQPRVHRPAGPVGRRQGATAVIDGLSRLHDRSGLADVVEPALGPLPDTDLHLIRVRARSTDVTLPAALAERAGRPTEWLDVQPQLGRHRVAVDLSATSTQAPWTTMALAAAGVALVGTSELSGALPSGVSELVPMRDEARALRSEIVARIEQEELASREGHRLQRAVLEGHTAAHRARALAAAAGLSPAAPDRSVSAVVPTNRAHEIDNILTNIGRQSHEKVELVLVLHGVEVPLDDLDDRAKQAGVSHLTVVHADPGLTLGACMNLGVDAAAGSYVAKMDDDNYYGEHYLTDLVNAFSYSSAGIVGKWCHYVWLRSSGAVVLRYPDSEHRPERRIQGGSMLFDADVVRDLRFSDIPRAVDSDILDRAADHGVEIYSADRFNFVSIRGADRHAHTWTVQDSTFMTKTGRLMFYGDPRIHVSV